jgi:hypothetical protein
MSDFSRTARGFDADNLAAARIILADVEKYGGKGSLMAIWARIVLARASAELPPSGGPLFDLAGA